MRIVCPACAAAYDVPEARLDGRRSVRCARCGESWTPELPAPELPAPELPTPELPTPELPAPEATLAAETPSVPAEEPAPPPLAAAVSVPASEPEASISTGSPKLLPPAPPDRAGPPLALSLAWAGSILAVAGLLLFLAIDRHAIATAWPPMQRAYAALQLRY